MFFARKNYHTCKMGIDNCIIHGYNEDKFKGEFIYWASK